MLAIVKCKHKYFESCRGYQRSIKKVDVLDGHQMALGTIMQSAI